MPWQGLGGPSVKALHVGLLLLAVLGRGLCPGPLEAAAQARVWAQEDCSRAPSTLPVSPQS